jgi:urea transporter
MKDTSTIITILAVVLLLIVLGPILTIWALNTLFPALAIPFTIETWFAIVILGAALKSNVTVKKS